MLKTILNIIFLSIKNEHRVNRQRCEYFEISVVPCTFSCRWPIRTVHAHVIWRVWNCSVEIIFILIITVLGGRQNFIQWPLGNTLSFCTFIETLQWSYFFLVSLREAIRYDPQVSVCRTVESCDVTMLRDESLFCSVPPLFVDFYDDWNERKS